MRTKKQKQAYQKKWNRLNRDYVNDYRRGYYGSIYNVASRFGVTPDRARELIKKREEIGCEICRVLGMRSPKKCQIDHNHYTGEIRGILCCFHNVLVGYLEKATEIEFIVAKTYLVKYGPVD
jgi:hypothetical protein